MAAGVRKSGSCRPETPFSFSPRAWYGMPRRDPAYSTGSCPDGRYTRDRPSRSNTPPRPLVSSATMSKKVSPIPSSPVGRPAPIPAKSTSAGLAGGK